MFSEQHSIGVRDAMYAGAVTQGRAGMAAGAIHLARRKVVVRVLVGQIIVTTGAGVGLMNRTGEEVGVGKEGEGQARGVCGG